MDSIFTDVYPEGYYLSSQFYKGLSKTPYGLRQLFVDAHSSRLVNVRDLSSRTRLIPDQQNELDNLYHLYRLMTLADACSTVELASGYETDQRGISALSNLIFREHSVVGTSLESNVSAWLDTSENKNDLYNSAISKGLVLVEKYTNSVMAYASVVAGYAPYYLSTVNSYFHPLQMACVNQCEHHINKLSDAMVIKCENIAARKAEEQVTKQTISFII